MDETTHSLLEAVRRGLNSLPIGSAEGRAIIAEAEKSIGALAKHLDGLKADLPDIIEPSNETVTTTLPESLASSSVEGERRPEPPEDASSP